MVAASSITILLLALAIAIAAKLAPEQKSHVKMPLKRSSITNLNYYNVVENDKHRTKYLRGRAGNQNDSMSSKSIPSTHAIYQGFLFSVTIGVGNPITNCKWLQHLVADEVI